MNVREHALGEASVCKILLGHVVEILSCTEQSHMEAFGSSCGGQCLPKRTLGVRVAHCEMEVWKHISLSVFGMLGERLSTFNTFFAESLTKLQDIIFNQTDQSTQEEERDQEGPLQQDQNFAEEGEANREGPEHDQTVQAEVRQEDARGSRDPPPQRKAGPRRRGPALMKRKCDVEDCSKKRSSVAHW